MQTDTQHFTYFARLQLPQLAEVEAINWRKVESSFISHVAWVHTGARKGIVLVMIQNRNGQGGMYAYFDIPSWKYASWFLPGTSIGSFYCKVFKGAGEVLWKWQLMNQVQLIQPAQPKQPKSLPIGKRAERMLKNGHSLGLIKTNRAA